MRLALVNFSDEVLTTQPQEFKTIVCKGLAKRLPARAALYTTKEVLAALEQVWDQAETEIKLKSISVR